MPEPSTPPPTEPTPVNGPAWRAEVAVRCEVDGLVGAIERVIDPSSAEETIHWGRNYVYAATFDPGTGPLEVVVKQFRNQGLRRRLERRLKGSKAERSWRIARALTAAGIATPKPVLLVESTAADGPSFFVTRRLVGAFEVRHFFRRLQQADNAGAFPEVEPRPFLVRLGRFARRLHDAGIFYRDLSMGNILARAGEGGELCLYLVDPNRARLLKRLGLVTRCRDLCRLPIVEGGLSTAFLSGYWGHAPPRSSPRWWLWSMMVRGYLLKHTVKNRLRRKRKSHAAGGTHHAHIPPPEQGAAVRDRVVWDRLSDQPHQHAGRWAKTWIRLADAPSHLAEVGTVVAVAAKVRRRYRELMRGLYREPVTMEGFGVCVRPWPGQIEAQMAALETLGARSVLLRLHPWESEHDDEESLARALAESGYEVTFALPQNRDLVRDRARWRAAVEELAERFAPFGTTFQVGQAPNRSKWGVWTRGEYVELAGDACDVLRSRPGVRIIGPAVIDFELQTTAAILNWRSAGFHFDALASLLYVDRRGAPENRQLGFDTVAKVALVKAIADTARNCDARSWITEVNWPLWEGPHAPAGRSVSVDEESQASYLTRFYLLALGTGLVERVFWWRLAARGYGLITPESDGSRRRRPSFEAMRTLVARLREARFTGPLPAPEGAFLYGFDVDGRQEIVAWSLEPGVRVPLPWPEASAVSRDGRPHDGVLERDVELGPAPVYLTPMS